MRIAITGGIGAGKSFVCRMLSGRGIDVYDCDAAAKRLMRESAVIRDALRRLAGDDVYAGDVLQKGVMAKFLLADKRNNEAVNAIVHPAVAADFLASGKEWLESAILFDSGFNLRVAFDRIVCVAAPAETRVRRIMSRDGISRRQAEEWMRRQMDTDEMARRSDFVISNDGTEDLAEQLDRILNSIYDSGLPRSR